MNYRVGPKSDRGNNMKAFCPVCGQTHDIPESGFCIIVGKYIEEDIVIDCPDEYEDSVSEEEEE